MNTIDDLEIVLVIVSALLGSIKASVLVTSNKHCIHRAIDIALGVLCGVLLPNHFANHGSTALSCILALLGGVSGTMVIEVFMLMLPSIAKEIIKSWASKIK